MSFLSSFSVVCAVLFSLMATPTQALELLERDTPENSSEFTEDEKNLARTDPEYFTLNADSVRITLLEVIEEPGMNYVELQEQPPKDLNGIAVTIDKIVNTASKIWQIVKENAPAVNIATKYATAYPQGVIAASQLAQWSRPRGYVYGFYAENLYGSVMIDCKYKVTYTYNGTYKGKGKYLTGVTVIPSVASVGWGYKFYMSASVPDSTVVNVGTAKDPLAALQLTLNWKMASVLKEVNGASVYYVQGDGYFEETASPFAKKEVKMEDIKSAAPLLLDPAKVF